MFTILLGLTMFDCLSTTCMYHMKQTSLWLSFVYLPYLRVKASKKKGLIQIAGYKYKEGER